MNEYYKAAWTRIFIIILALGFSFLLAFPIIWLWNFTIAQLINGVSQITYWQAYCLNMLVSILWGDSIKINNK